jgi:hypothetical protein
LAQKHARASSFKMGAAWACAEGETQKQREGTAFEAKTRALPAAATAAHAAAAAHHRSAHHHLTEACHVLMM